MLQKPRDRARNRIQGEKPEQLHGNQSCTSCFPQGSAEHIPVSPDPQMEAQTTKPALPPLQEEFRIWPKDLVDRRLVYPAIKPHSSTPLLCVLKDREEVMFLMSARWTSAFPAQLCSIQKSSTLISPIAAISSAQCHSLENGWLPLWKTSHFQWQNPPGRVTEQRKHNFLSWGCYQ